MKFPTLTQEIIIIKASQKQARQCYAEKLKLAPYPPIREPAKPHHTTAEGTQVMSVDKGSKIQVLTVYQDSMGDEFDINPRDHTSDRGQKPIE